MFYLFFCSLSHYSLRGCLSDIKLDKECGDVIMNIMNRKIIVAAILVATSFVSSGDAVMAYNQPSGWAAPPCNSEQPAKAWLYRVKSLGKGKYQLFWDKSDKASSWTIGYGTEPGKYIYGLNNFGNSESRNLIVNTYSNRKFYFVIKANNGCMPGEWSNEWKVGSVATTGTYTPTVKTEYTTPETTLIEVSVAPTKTPVVSLAPQIEKTVTAAPTEVIPTKVKSAPVTTTTEAMESTKKTFWEWLIGLFK